MFGGISQRAFLDVAYQGGATDAFLSRVYSGNHSSHKSEYPQYNTNYINIDELTCFFVM